MISKVKKRSVFRGHDEDVQCLCFSDDGKEICSVDLEGVVILWNMENRTELCRNRPTKDLSSGTIKYVDFVKTDKRMISTGSTDGKVVIWTDRLRVGTLINLSPKCMKPIHSVKFSLRGKRLVVSCGDGSIRVWDVTRIRQKNPFEELKNCHNDENLNFSHSEFLSKDVIMSGGSDGCIKLWDLRQKKKKNIETFKQPGKGEIRCLSFYQGSYETETTLIASGGRRIAVREVDFRMNRELKTPESQYKGTVKMKTEISSPLLDNNKLYFSDIDIHRSGRLIISCSKECYSTYKKVENPLKIVIGDCEDGSVQYCLPGDKHFTYGRSYTNTIRFQPTQERIDVYTHYFASGSNSDVFLWEMNVTKELILHSEMMEQKKKEKEVRNLKNYVNETMLPITRDGNFDDDHTDVELDLKSLKLESFVAGGSYGHCFVCHIDVTNNEKGLKEEESEGEETVVKKKSELFVAKFLIDDLDNEFSREEILEKEVLRDIGYHRNLVSVIRIESTYKVDEKALTKCKNKEIKKEETEGEEEEDDDDKKKKMPLYLDGIVVMNHYGRSLQTHLNIKKVMEFSEICYVIKGVLSGVQHLNKNLICHRDLHMGNIFLRFIDEPKTFRKLCRVYVGDYGKAFDFRGRNDFKPLGEEMCVKVAQDDTDVDYVNFWPEEPTGSYVPHEYDLGGNDDFIAPEIMKKGAKVLDYAYNDIFAIGTLGMKLMEFQDKEKKDDAFSMLLKLSLKGLFGRMILEEKKKRISYEEAIVQMDVFIANIEQGLKK